VLFAVDIAEQREVSLGLNRGVVEFDRLFTHDIVGNIRANCATSRLLTVQIISRALHL
jgi:hypothetical protein